MMHRPISRLLIPALILLCARTPLAAQAQFSGWLATFQNYKLSKHAGLYFDGQFRSGDRWAQTQQILLRPGFNYYLSSALTVTAGYAYVANRRTVNGVGGLLTEHRSWEQLMLTHRLFLTHKGPAASLTHRLRLEQRYLPKPLVDGNTLRSNGHVYAGRLRYFVRGIQPIGASGAGPAAPSASPASSGTAGSGGTSAARPAFTQGFYAALTNEIFLNVGDASPVNGKFFDQNRAYVAFGYRFSRQFDTEIGYVNQYTSGTGDNSTTNHILQCATYIRL